MINKLIALASVCLLPILGQAADFEQFRQSCVREVNSGTYKNRSCIYNLDLPSPFFVKCLRTIKKEMEINAEIKTVSYDVSNEHQLNLEACGLFFENEWSPWRDYVDYDFSRDLPTELYPIYLELDKTYN